MFFEWLKNMFNVDEHCDLSKHRVHHHVYEDLCT